MMHLLNAVATPWGALDNFFEEFARSKKGNSPRVNVWENEKGIVLEAEIAGVDPADVEISTEGNTLTLQGVKSVAGGEKTSFRRQFALPFELSESDITATAKNGLLTVDIPRKAAAKRKIAVQQL